jgi:citrate lyase subunit beta / citryl-CoA lyase
MTVEAPRAPSAKDSLRPRRSCLYMPGANAKALAKARELPADTLLFDLEDAVAPEAKADARAAISAALGEGGYGAREIVVRVNALTTEWGADDVKAALAARPAGLLFPKIQDAADIEAADRALGSADVALWAMIETPLAILNIKEIAAAAQRTRLAVFVMGTNDLAKDMRAAQPADRAPALFALSLSIAAARAYGLTAIDGVYNDIQNETGFLSICQQGKALGFDGKTLIHPTQIAPCNVVFSPAPEEVTQARDVIAAFADPANAGKGVLKINGRMTELLHLAEAQRIVAMAEAIG